MRITTIIAKYLGIGTIFIKEYENTKKSNRKCILPIVFHFQIWAIIHSDIVLTYDWKSIWWYFFHWYEKNNKDSAKKFDKTPN